MPRIKMSLLSLVLIACVALVSAEGAGATSVDASPVLQRWDAVYGGHQGYGAMAEGVQVSPDGKRVFVTGTGDYESASHYVTVAHDAVTGTPIWMAFYGGLGWTYVNDAKDLVISPDGSKVFVTGSSLTITDVSYGVSDIATVAYDAATGRELWVARSRSLPGSRDAVNAMVISPDGTRLYVAGESVNRDTGDSDYVTVAYNSHSGEEIWTKTEPDISRQSSATAVTVAPDGQRLFVTGVSVEPGPGWGDTELETVSYDTTDGTKRWSTTHDSYQDRPADVAIDPRGETLLVAGRELLALDVGTGVTAWRGGLAMPGFDRPIAHDIALSPDGGNVFAAVSSASLADFVVIAFDATNGARLWDTRRTGGVFRGHSPSSLAVSSDGLRVYAAGTGYPLWPYGVAITAAVHAKTGAELWTAHYPSSLDSAVLNEDDGEAIALALSTDGKSLYLAGNRIHNYRRSMTIVAYDTLTN